ncbi:hypothetical protein ARMGADRAFT_1033119 [Armillaria gallica]|uniref:Uncharacterized protein n=1 Tax=Armillaria gallica TaxID=47427 RepID=A0A2H3DDR3_ARMGA|nr:hypothetical protein ARMGADRAFT_1033119 [Armillaria gallica]
MSPPGKRHDAKPSGIRPDTQAFFGDRKNFGLDAGNATTLSVQQFQHTHDLQRFQRSLGWIGIGIHAIVNLVRLKMQTRFHAHGYCTRRLLPAAGNRVSPGKAVKRLGSIVALAVVSQTACRDFNRERGTPFSWLCMRFCDDHTFVVKNVRIGVTASTCRVSDTDLQW